MAEFCEVCGEHLHACFYSGNHSWITGSDLVAEKMAREEEILPEKPAELTCEHCGRTYPREKMGRCGWCERLVCSSCAMYGVEELHRGEEGVSSYNPFNPSAFPLTD